MPMPRRRSNATNTARLALMKCPGDFRVLFRVAAGPRRGFGHLLRTLSLARALGVRPLLSLRGPAPVVETALALGADVLAQSGLRSLKALAPDIVVIDDPVRAAARRWIEAARRSGALVVTVHDLGVGCPDGDVVIDGSVTKSARPAGRTAFTGTRYAIIDPDLSTPPVERLARQNDRRVLVALGGGPRRTTALAIAEAIAALDPRAEVRIAGGFDTPVPAPAPSVAWLPPARGLSRELHRANVAVVGGGVSLYEACSAGVPTVGLPVVPGQVPTVRAFGRRGAVVAMPFRSPGRRTAAAVVALLDDPRRREVLKRRALRLVDGKGAMRAAAAVLEFARRSEP
jgi:spore coat polysaccharide biosynthesis predicted glycosyltransferase SpsG